MFTPAKKHLGMLGASLNASAGKVYRLSREGVEGFTAQSALRVYVKVLQREVHLAWQIFGK